MANTILPYEPDRLDTSRALIETLQAPRLRAGGPSSSSLLNRALNYIKRDLLHVAVETADVADQTRVLALAMHAQNAALARQYQSLLTLVQGLDANSGSNRATAELFGNALTIADGTQTTCDVNPLFGQATLPALSRQSLLVVERQGGRPIAPPEAALLIALERYVNTTADAVPPPDYAFGEDDYGVFALDPSTASPWIIEDPTTAPHVAWIQIDVPGGVSGGYRCNELEIVPNPAFAASLIAVQAEVVGQGWRDLDFSYLSGYDTPTRSVVGLGPSRLCFAEASITRFRLGLWVAGCFGFSSVRVLRAVYNATARLGVDFSSKTNSPLTRVLVSGKDAARLAYLDVAVTGGRAAVTLAPLGPSSETPVITSVSCTW